MKAWAVFGAFCGFVIWMVVGSVFNGYVLSVTWGWFVVPTFGVPKLSIVAAIGLAMVINYITYQEIDCDPRSETNSAKITRGVTMSIMRPSLFLFLGWIVHLFM